ncbi:UbiH/UbiF family hydroxylase [Aliihoeflea sp. PC F10.4]
MTDRNEYEILVAGTGPVGMIAALAVAQAGFRAAIAGPKTSTADARTTAIMHPGIQYLASLSLNSFLEEHGAPLRTMRIVDATERLIRSPTVTFHASELGLSAFGRNVANAQLNAALEKAVLAHSGIGRIEGMVESWHPAQTHVTATMSGGTELSAGLVIAADGRGSSARLAAGIDVDTKPTGQTAIVLSFYHTRPHEGISTEFHTASGPFTQVPLAGNRSSLVWVVRTEDAPAILALDRPELADRIEQQKRSMLGRVTVETEPQTFPLTTSRPRHYATNRIALVGEAAHVFPPIGAQGLNLGIRDVEALVAVAERYRADPGSAEAMEAYASKRRPDIALRSGAVDLLNRSLLSDLLPAQVARSAVFEALRALPPMRNFFMREGMKPGSGLNAFLPLRTRDRQAEGRT